MRVCVKSVYVSVCIGASKCVCVCVCVCARLYLPSTMDSDKKNDNITMDTHRGRPRLLKDCKSHRNAFETAL